MFISILVKLTEIDDIDFAIELNHLQAKRQLWSSSILEQVVTKVTLDDLVATLISAASLTRLVENVVTNGDFVVAIDSLLCVE